METLDLTIDGMSCGHCVRAVTKALGSLDGVAVDRVAVGTAQMTFDPARVGRDAILRAITDEGFTPRPKGS